ncbi:MAG: acyl--CoA ligase [Solirubrobacterales bacterium]|nr:acyl--CoA ligase [Solirubrobacterales bacterium]MBV9713854.1 acyl--CoA ligase [Solirubrobacterales bacterium]
MVLGRALSWTAERYPEHTAVAGERPLTYREWDRRTNRLARALAELGVRRGGRVAIVAGNGEPLSSTHLAANKLGAASVPLNVRYAADELAYCLKDAEPAVLLSDDSSADLVTRALAQLEGPAPVIVHAGENPPEGCRHGLERLIEAASDGALDVPVGPDDISVMLYTAGTTGRPKGVPRRQHAEVSAGLAHTIQARYGFGEATLCAMPMYHTMGLRSLVSMVLVGGKLAFLPAFAAGPALEAIARERLTALYLVPTAYWSLLQQAGVEQACASVSKLAYAGAAMTANLTGKLAEAVRPEVFINHYGSTEVYTFSVEADAAARPGSAGRPGLFTRLRLVEPDPGRRVGPGEEVAAGETGEIIASLTSDEAFAGYWQRPDANERALRDGWYFTGDLGEVDEEGNLHVSGRVDDMVISGGENVHPLEVEDALARCPAVAEVAVAGLPDDKWGQAVTAFVVSPGEGEPARRAEEIAKWTRAESGLAAYKRPKRIVVLDEIPKSPVGKILRRELVAGEYEPRGEAAP